MAAEISTNEHAANGSHGRCTLSAQNHRRHDSQILVRLNNAKTHLLKFSKTNITNDDILSQLSKATSLPKRMLRLHTSSSNDSEHNHNYNVHNNKLEFLSAFTFLPILGGKGGFGTLLKGQSKQAGAKQTMDFGACRDLNGRRLRHVNDEIKLRHWRESVHRRARDSIKNGGMGSIDVEKEMEELRTASGIRNWHLAVPSWGAGEISGKSRYREERKMRRELENMARKQNEAVQKKLQKKRDIEKVQIDYASLGKGRAEIEDAKLSFSILEGLKKRRRINLGTDSASDIDAKVDGNGSNSSDLYRDSNEDGMGNVSSLVSTVDSFLCTLSGEFVVGEDEMEIKANVAPNDDMSAKQVKVNSTMIQSKSEFSSVAILLDHEKLEKEKKNCKGLYYEISIETEGIAQIGWGHLLTSKRGEVLPSTGKNSFVPNSDTGDGVGDDGFSYGYDGSRSKIFHDGKEIAYGDSKRKGWKKGDVIGCLYNFCNGTISFSVNGIDLGTAFDNVTKKDFHISPVLSLNEHEIIGMAIGPVFRHCPADHKGISQFILQSRDGSNGVSDGEKKAEGLNVPKSAPRTMKSSTANKSLKSAMKTDSESAVKSPVDLQKYDSPKDLETLGMDHLKAELFRLGCKCGGSLVERAKRLYSIKGLARHQIPKKLRSKNFKD